IIKAAQFGYRSVIALCQAEQRFAFFNCVRADISLASHNDHVTVLTGIYFLSTGCGRGSSRRRASTRDRRTCGWVLERSQLNGVTPFLRDDKNGVLDGFVAFGAKSVGLT